VELLKAADDIHQDLLLGRPQRGGRSAVWWAFGHAQAINAGDGLYALARLTAMDVVEAGGADAAVRTLARMDEAWWARCLEREARREEEGVQRQAARSLTALATALGSQAAGAPPEVTAGLELFGRELGAALHRNEEMDGFFNSTGEDLLRMLDEGGPEILLKPVRSLPPGERVVLDAVVQRRQPVDDAALAAVREVVERAGGRARLQEAIDGHLKEALAALGSIPDSAPLARAAHELLS
jgi:geranylgeranyl pyrophosphate synthase